MDKKDYFGATASQYEQFRPRYSSKMRTDIFKIMSELETEHKQYLDVACGTGQLLFPIGQNFERAIGVDLSENQIEQAKQKVKDSKFTVKQIDCSNLQAVLEQVNATPPLNLISIGQGLHWFKIPEFIKQVQKIINPDNGVFAVLGYSAFEFDPEDGKAEAIIKPIFKEYMSQLIPYFACNRAILEDKYAHFPFDSYFVHVVRLFYPEKLKSYTIDAFLKYLSTMSSLGPFKEAKGYDALEKFIVQIKQAFTEAGIVKSEEQFLGVEIKAIVPYYSIIMCKPLK